MKRYVAPLFLALAATVPTFAQQPIGSAGWLNTRCIEAQAVITDQTAMDVGECDGFMIGWRTGVVGLSILDNGKPFQILLTDGVTVGQMERVFISYMAKHPELENKTGDLALTRALIDVGLLVTKPVPVSITAH
jgi:hypothetical protein